MKTNPYETLGVSPKATAEQIKKAYRKKAKSAHPDTAGTDEEMVEVNSAYALLANPMRRAKFDQTGKVEDEKSIEQQAASELQILAILLFSAGEWKQRDLFAEMKNKIVMQIQNIDLQRDESERKVIRFMDAIKRIIRKGKGENFIRTAFEQELYDARALIKVHEQKIEVMQAMIVQIDLFNWTADKRQNPFNNPFYGTMMLGKYHQEA